MKKIILASLVAATVLTPVASQAANGGPRTARVSTLNDNDVSFQRGEGRWGEGRRGDGERRRGGENRGPRNQPPRLQAPPAQPPRELNRQLRWSEGRNRGEAQRGEDRRPGRPDMRQDRRNYDRDDDARVDRRWDRNDDRRADRWSNGWRNDRRYDWRSYRDRNRGYYSPGLYHSPYRGRHYSRIGIGFALGAGYYGSRYWIDDPWSYRLPAAYGPYRWVRYYDDVLLVDLRSGRVVDVIYDFFW